MTTRAAFRRQSPPGPINALPDELLCLIVRLVSPKDKRALCRVSARFRRIVNDEHARTVRYVCAMSPDRLQREYIAAVMSNHEDAVRYMLLKPETLARMQPIVERCVTRRLCGHWSSRTHKRAECVLARLRYTVPSDHSRGALFFFGV
jgi:hypothetical protein